MLMSLCAREDEGEGHSGTEGEGTEQSSNTITLINAEQMERGLGNHRHIMSPDPGPSSGGEKTVINGTRWRRNLELEGLRENALGAAPGAHRKHKQFSKLSGFHFPNTSSVPCGSKGKVRLSWKQIPQSLSGTTKTKDGSGATNEQESQSPEEPRSILVCKAPVSLPLFTAPKYGKGPRFNEQR
ncbi:hypothetical protein CB1_001095010 [Camelus ferus]|nr:hypothetical protein CB1_001095010 [Camelus ferus]